jgi:pyruvate dehydrogenase E2 component (dihydrolipoamide acetyltransferase)
MYEFKLPDVGEGIHEAEVLKWLVNIGDMVAMDQPILEIQTDKAIVEIPTPVAGKVLEIRAEAGTIAQVGDVLIAITPADAQTITPKKSSNGQQAAQSEQKALKAGIAGPGQRVLAAPAVRKMALELGIDLADVPGSGPVGRVLPNDVRSFAEQQKTVPAESPIPTEIEPEFVTASTPAPIVRPPVEPAEAPAQPLARQPGQEIIEEEPLQGLRRRIAERMEVAWEIPHVTSFEEVEVGKLMALRGELQPEAERRGTRLTYLPFIIKAVVQVLKEFPYFNASLDMQRQKILHHRYYHIGVATAVPGGLLVPVVRRADRMNLVQLAVELKRLADLAHERKLSMQELSGSTFTITNFGSYGGRMGTPIINPPEVAILGTGRIEEKPVVVEGEIAVRPILPLALSYDHRLIDGAASGQFLGRLTALLSDPNQLFLDLV